MQNLRARAYDPANGRFIGLDSFAGNMQDPQSLHKYAYVHGDPVQGIDPTGRFNAISVAIGVGIGVKLGALATIALGALNFAGDTSRQLRRENMFGLGGYDVTEELEALRVQTVLLWDGLTTAKKQQVIDEMHSSNPSTSLIKGWDVVEFGSARKKYWQSSSTGEHAVNTVTYRRHVYPIADINYIWWGMINGLAFRDGIETKMTGYFDMTTKVVAYRTVFGPIVQLTPAGWRDGVETTGGKKAWAEFGWTWITNNMVQAPEQFDVSLAGPNHKRWPYALQAGAGIGVNQFQVVTPLRNILIP